MVARAGLDVVKVERTLIPQGFAPRELGPLIRCDPFGLRLLGSALGLLPTLCFRGCGGLRDDWKFTRASQRKTILRTLRLGDCSRSLGVKPDARVIR
jgi:hypothetical protein